MEETATTITWPSKLKIGAKSKKGESMNNSRVYQGWLDTFYFPLALKSLLSVARQEQCVLG